MYRELGLLHAYVRTYAFVRTHSVGLGAGTNREGLRMDRKGGNKRCYGCSHCLDRERALVRRVFLHSGTDYSRGLVLVHPHAVALQPREIPRGCKPHASRHCDGEHEGRQRDPHGANFSWFGQAMNLLTEVSGASLPLRFPSLPEQSCFVRPLYGAD